MKRAFQTDFGSSYEGKIEDFFRLNKFKKYQGEIDLILTSPPYPLIRKKKYGNLNGDEYLEWFEHLASGFSDLLSPEGSIVIELGNTWNEGTPTMSTLTLRALLAFLSAGSFHLCEQFVWYNSAKLPSPTEWVNKRRIRVKDAFTHIWWMSKSEFPKANNRNVLENYSPAMNRLIDEEETTRSIRPSEHVINTKSFKKNNGGAIPSNVLVSGNTSNQPDYLSYCKGLDVLPHPARMPKTIPEFFINFLTDEGDLVLDPFGGSNTTGAVAESLSRRWLSVEPNEEYILGSMFHFDNLRK